MGDEAPDPARRELTFIGAVLLVVAVLHVAIGRALPLSASDYQEPVLLAAAFSDPVFVLLGALPFSVPFLAWRTLRWGGNVMATASRPVAMTCGGVLAWSFSVYEPNQWAGQLHLDARVTIVVLAVCIWWHPAFVGPLVACVALQASQFEFPIGGYSMTDKQPVLSILVVLVAFLVVSMSGIRAVPRAAPTLAVAVMASWYAAAGLGKLAIGWPVTDDLGNLVASAQANGWLWWWSETTALRVAHWVSVLNPLLVVGTLVVEVGAVFALGGRIVARWVLVGALVLHASIFLSSGIAFWKWVAVDLALLMWLRRGDLWTAPDRTGRFLVPAGVVIAGGVLWGASPLAWYDAPINIDYEIEAVGVSGTVYRVDAAYFAPYDIVFAQQRFDFLGNDRRLVDTYGSTRDRDLLERLNEASSIDLDRWRSEFGSDVFDPRRAHAFDELVRAFFDDPSGAPDPWILRYVRPPGHIWAREPTPRYEGQEAVMRVIVRRVTTLRRDERHQIIEDVPIRAIRIAAGS